MRLSSFFRHCETDFLRIFYCSSHQFLIFCNRIDVQKIPKRPPFTFFGTMRLTGTFKKVSKKIRNFFSQFLVFLRAFVVSSCRKSGFRFRVFLSLRYGAELGRSRLVEICSCLTWHWHFFSQLDGCQQRSSSKLSPEGVIKLTFSSNQITNHVAQFIRIQLGAYLNR